MGKNVGQHVASKRWVSRVEEKNINKIRFFLQKFLTPSLLSDIS